MAPHQNSPLHSTLEEIQRGELCAPCSSLQLKVEALSSNHRAGKKKNEVQPMPHVDGPQKQGAE
jgi:hypothetical protein